jgi:hypothetical protein
VNLRKVGAWILVIPAPFAVATVYLVLSRWPTRLFTEFSDFAALIAAIAVGLVGIVLLAKRGKVRVALVLAYIPITVFVLGIYSMVFVCDAFGDCL